MGAETLSESLWLPMRLTFSHGRFPVQVGTLTALSFVVGALTSILAGYIGMMVAVYSNARTTVSAKKEGEDGEAKEGGEDVSVFVFKASR